MLENASKKCLKGVVILIMHRVDESPRPWDITPSELEQLCKVLIEVGYRENVVTYTQLEKLGKLS